MDERLTNTTWGELFKSSDELKDDFVKIVNETHREHLEAAENARRNGRRKRIARQQKRRKARMISLAIVGMLLFEVALIKFIMLIAG